MASKKMKGRKRRQENKSQSPESESESEEMIRDPLEVFGTDIMLDVLGNLDAHSLALSLLVCRRWNAVVSSDSLWASKCEELWLQKAHIPRVSQMNGLTRLAAYSLSAMDGKRARITKYDLCDHVWEFHFNKGAPEYWRGLDPFWRGCGPRLRRYFHLDGSQTADPCDKTWGGHESSYCIVTSFVGDGKMREHYVRINRWPRMSVHRKPDWSWMMVSALYCYSSIPDPSKRGGTGPLVSANIK